MKTNELLAELSQKGIKIWVDDDQLSYRAPKGVLTASLREELTKHKKEILTLLDGVSSQDLEKRLPSVEPDPDHRHLPFPLTDIQEAYWIGRREGFDLGNVAMHGYLELESMDLDLELLNRSWNRVVDRHDMLRAIILEGGQQQILEGVRSYQIEVLDLRGQDPQEVESKLEAIRERMSHQVLPLSEWPLFEIRASLLDGERIRVHISLDGTNVDVGSLMILLHDWMRFYAHPEIELSPLELSYRDYVLAERELQETELYQRSLAYWRKRLPSLPPAPDLPLARDPSTVTHPRFVRRRSSLDPGLWSRLKERASQAGVTPSGVLLAAFSEVLASWSSSVRFTVNVPLFNRLPLHPQVNEIVGDFTSMILLEADGSGESSFEDRARRIQDGLWEGLEHRYVSGVRVLREYAQAVGRRSGALMPVVFTSTLGLGIRGSIPLNRLGEGIYGISQTPQVLLDHHVYEESDALVFNWDAVEEVFPDGMLDTMFDVYCNLLERLSNEEEFWQRGSLELVPGDQLEQRDEVNTTGAPIPEGLLHSLFADQVRERPEQTAVVSSGLSLSYEDLSRRSNQVGRRLRELGASPNKLVAVVMEKGWEQVVGVLGVLSSGAAYLPIDPDLPKERIWYLLENGEVGVVLTQTWLDERLEWPDGVERLCVDGDEISGVDDSSLDVVQGSDDLAYVIYTSGSTGVPKGVMIEHRSMVNRIVDVNSRFGIGSGDRVFGLTALHHDLSVYDIFGVLAAGGTLVLPDASGVRDPDHWLELMGREGVTVWNSVPAFMEMLVEYGEHASGRGVELLGSLRLVLLAGDWIPVSLPDRIRGLFEGAEVISLGGPTETTVWDICYPVGEVDSGWSSIPYGRAMLNSRYHVLNERLEACPVWVPGELYIGGVGLARGYWRDEEKTASRFIGHPRTGERLYRSGDLGRYLPDGNIEFLGRKDFQVKIGGYRIELGEIESTLRQHSSVRDTVVSVLGDSQGSRRLVAYVVLSEDKASAIEVAGKVDVEIAGTGFDGAEQEKSNGDGVKSGWGESFKKWGSSLAKKVTGVRSYVNVVPALFEGVELVDERSRIAFKLAQHGLRSEENGNPSVQFIRPVEDDRLLRAYKERSSYRSFLYDPISLDQFGDFLSCLSHIELDGLPKYRYGSAGSLYPVQTYLYIKPGRVEGLSEGVYYYHPRDHRLVMVSSGGGIDRTVHFPTNLSVFDESGFSLFLIGKLSAIVPMYGSLAEGFCALEAGYMSQLLMSTSPGRGIGLCPIGGLDFERIRGLFDLDEDHVYLHSLVGGKIAVDSIPVSNATGVARPRVRVDDAVGRELRDFAGSKLPDYMVPSSFVMLDALPLTANGKVDRKTLPDPGKSIYKSIQNLKESNDPVVERIAQLVGGVLKVDNIDPGKNLLELGANSLALLKIANLLESEFGFRPKIGELVHLSTLEITARYYEIQELSFPSVNDDVEWDELEI